MPAPNPTPPANRAARRARQTEPVPPATRYRGPAAPSRPGWTPQPQGRRIAPVRRTG